jgi:hypothetical protein
MGEIADDIIEDGEYEWLLHLAGECCGDCYYCIGEEDEPYDFDDK